MGRVAGKLASVVAITIVAAPCACGRVEESQHASAGGSAGVSANHGGSVSVAAAGSGGRSSCGAPLLENGGKAGFTVQFDTSDCAPRPQVTCDIATLKEELRVLSGPNFTLCERYMSYDGCGRLAFFFDSDGCLQSVLTPADANGRVDDHVAGLGACVSAVFHVSRWPCLADSQIDWCESCFVR
ncbi:MAG: hypothetical protein ACOY0T_21280 [Myxococcota bacterium]